MPQNLPHMPPNLRPEGASDDAGTETDGLKMSAKRLAARNEKLTAARNAKLEQQKTAQATLLAAAADDDDPLPENTQPIQVKPTASRARIRPRHRMMLFSFVLCVLVPVIASAAYLWGVAVDQYASTVGFSVRREEASSPMDFLGGLAGFSKSSSSDTDVLYEYLKSQEIVADLDTKIHLRDLWAKPLNDPYFAFDPSGSIEDLVDYWSRMVQISYDGSSGLLEVKVLAFTPQDATLIAETLFQASSDMINQLSAIARNDAIHYAQAELEEAQSRLKTARAAITQFRVSHQIVDPTTDIQSQAGLIGSLQNQLAAAQIELDLLMDKIAQTDPRRLQAQRKIEVIEARISAERGKVGVSSSGVSPDSDYAAMVGDYERLAVEREFAEKAYVLALGSFDGAQAEARRKSRYLAAHILPTTAQVSRYPERVTQLAIVALFAFLAWAIGTLVIYSLKDRR